MAWFLQVIVTGGSNKGRQSIKYHQRVVTGFILICYTSLLFLMMKTFKWNGIANFNGYFNLQLLMHLSSAFPGRGTPGLPGGNQLKLKKSVPQYRSLFGLLGLFLA